MKKITINDIAKLAGVSKTTVSFYLNGMYEKMSAETRQQIERVVEKTGYQPSVVARSLNAKSNRLIGVMIGDSTNHFANQVIKGINQTCSNAGYKVILTESNYLLENEKSYLQLMNSINVDGFIVQPTTNFEDIYKTICLEKPLVVFDSPIRESQYHWIKTDSYNAVNKAVVEMANKGYEQFIYVTADASILNTRKERYDGFIDAVKPLNLENHVIMANNETTIEQLSSHLLPWIESNKTTCIVVANNWLLTKVYVVLKDFAEKIPNQIGLVGFDSLEWSQLANPSVTTIVQPSYLEGQTAAQMLIDIIENKDNIENKVLPCYLNRQQSTNRK